MACKVHGRSWNFYRKNKQGTSYTKKKLIPGTKESLDADEFLALCSYLQINPQTIPIRQGEK